ncbi:MAG: PEGA domain-containing protein [Labilithrix sp.]|nr:PEGA domain-containing protein [Labilithrix sp.]
MKHVRSFALALALFMVASIAYAQERAASPSPEDAARAAEIKKRGDAAMDSARPAEALAAYVEAYAITKEPALLYNKGRALQVMGEYPQAIEELEAFDRTAPPELKARVPGLARMIADLRARVTTLTLSCDVMAAKVRLRDRTLGKCPLPEQILVPSGRAVLEVSADGYFTHQREVDLPPGGVARLDVKLASKQTSGVLVVKSNVANAEVAIDGKGFGMVPVEAIVGPGDHALVLTRDGYGAVKTNAVLAAGERREIDVPMEPEKGVFGRWWFWTGVGLAVAGGVALVVALNVEKDPQPGTVPPGVVQGGLTAPGFRF